MIGIWFLSILIIGLSVYRLVVYYNRVKQYYNVDAIVTGNDVKTLKGSMMGDQHFYSAIFTYTDRSGVMHEMISSEENPDRPLYGEGSKVRLLINPNDPTKFMVNDVVSGYVIPIIWICIGIAIVAIPLLFPETFAD